ncbi:MAG TPA: FAD-binding oxidoreductase [Candidatus Angelobacter sp.]|nr:FAD-binding oxidoreductase [Candidatus Angelobacter sp.]
MEVLRTVFSTAANSEEFAALFDELVERQEYALALKTLCGFLMEPDVPPIGAPEWQAITALHSLLPVDDQTFARLKNKVAEARKAHPPAPPLAHPPSPSPVSSPKPAPAPVHSSLRYKLIAIVGPDHVHPAGPSDEILGVHPKLVVIPGTETELAAVLRLANEAGVAVIPRGGLTKLGWGHPPARADIVLSTARLNHIIEHASSDLTVSVEAGCTIQTLQETLAQHGQRLAIDPLWPEKATVGGILSTNDSGALRLRFGALRDLIIGVTIALPDGTLASSGGKVVKNVAGYDLPKLVTGAFGTLGVITRAVFRVHPLPHHTRSFSISTANPAATRDLILALQNSKLAHTALQSHFSGEGQPTSEILFEGTEAGLDAQATQLRKICHPAEISEAAPAAWNAREALWSFAEPASATLAQIYPELRRAYPELKKGAGADVSSVAIAKISTLPANLSHTIEFFHRMAILHRIQWESVIYATGLGWFRLQGTVDHLLPALISLRTDLEKGDGFLALLHRPAKLSGFDPWGAPGDSLPLMKAIKHQLDPANTLNPGRFLSGI